MNPDNMQPQNNNQPVGPAPLPPQQPQLDYSLPSGSLAPAQPMDSTHTMFVQPQMPVFDPNQANPEQNFQQPQVQSPALMMQPQPMPIQEPQQQQPAAFPQFNAPPAPAPQFGPATTSFPAPMQGMPMMPLSNVGMINGGSMQSMSMSGLGQKRKKIILFGSIGAGVVILSVIGIIVFISMSKVTKEDYDVAYKQSVTTVDKYFDLSGNMLKIDGLNSYDTETQVTNNVDTVKKSMEAYKKEYATLSGMKAVKKGEESKLFDAYRVKNDKYVGYIDKYIPSAEKALVAVAKCETIFNSSAFRNQTGSFSTLIAPCDSALSSAGSVDDKDLSDFVKKYSDVISKVKTLLSEYASLPSSQYTRQSAINSEIRDLTDSLSKAQKDANSNIQKNLEDNKPQEELTKLETQLSTDSLKI